MKEDANFWGEVFLRVSGSGCLGNQGGLGVFKLGVDYTSRN